MCIPLVVLIHKIVIAVYVVIYITWNNITLIIDVKAWLIYIKKKVWISKQCVILDENLLSEIPYLK